MCPKRTVLLLCFALAFALPILGAQTVLVATNAQWGYLDDGSDQQVAWIAPDFDDSSWALSTNSLSPTAVTILHPPDESLVRAGSNLTVNVQVTGETDTITNVDLFVGVEFIGAAVPPQLDVLWEQVPLGNHLLTAVAQGSTGLSYTSPPINIVAVTNLLPVVTIMAPSNSSFLVEGDILIEATASDFDGLVTGVEFFESSVKIGQSTNAPYRLLWSNVSTGEFFSPLGQPMTVAIALFRPLFGWKCEPRNRSPCYGVLISKRVPQRA